MKGQELFDKDGRRIPGDLKSLVYEYEPDRSIKLVQHEIDYDERLARQDLWRGIRMPEIDYDERLARLMRFFPEGIKFVSTEEFQDRSEALLEWLIHDKLLFNLLNGAYFPICLPHFKVADYGKSLEEVFLKACGNSYENQFPGPKFYNYWKGELDKVYIIKGSRHDYLIARMADEPVVGIQFFPLQGFSLDADREQMALLPESLILSGAIDIATAITAFPDVLARGLAAGYDCAALSRGSSFVGSYCFWNPGGGCSGGGGGLNFDYHGNIHGAGDRYSGGLLFLG